MEDQPENVRENVQAVPTAFGVSQSGTPKDFHSGNFLANAFTYLPVLGNRCLHCARGHRRRAALPFGAEPHLVGVHRTLHLGQGKFWSCEGLRVRADRLIAMEIVTRTPPRAYGRWCPAGGCLAGQW